MNPAAWILAAALIVTLAALVCVLLGTSNMLDTERRRTDDAERRVREVEAELLTRSRNNRPASNVRPLRESPRFGAVADILARNEAARANPDTFNWDAPAVWTEGER